MAIVSQATQLTECVWVVLQLRIPFTRVRRNYRCGLKKSCGENSQMWPFQRVFYYRIHPLAMGMGTMIGFILTGYLTIIRRRQSEYC